MSVVYTEWKERPPPPYLLIFDHTIVKVSLAMWMLHIALCYTVVNLFHLTFIIIFSGLLDLTICSQQLLDGRSSVVHPGIIRPGWIVKRDRAGATARARNFDELWLIDHLVHNLYRHPLYVAVFRHFFFFLRKIKFAWQGRLTHFFSSCFFTETSHDCVRWLFEYGANLLIACFRLPFHWRLAS